jgi:3-hydroxyisobutyrate dehydrogenase-like beta-hydroxyacid dehydrogenase
MPQKQKIGIVGLGIMGRGMAANFLKHGYPLFVWNRTESVAQKFVREGASVCRSPKEVAQMADIVFEVTADDRSSRSVWMGKKGIVAGAHKGSTLIASATLSAGWTDQLSQVCQERKCAFADMALTGGRVGAETGALILLCGGQKKTIDRLRPTLSAIAKVVHHFGPAGHGMRYKLILNFLQAVHMIGFGQAMKIAKSCHMDLNKVSEALADKPGGAVTNIARKAYFKERIPITFYIELITKDLGYAKQLARHLDINLLNKVSAVYKKAKQQGRAQKDWASIVKML